MVASSTVLLLVILRSALAYQGTGFSKYLKTLAYVNDNGMVTELSRKASTNGKDVSIHDRNSLTRSEREAEVVPQMVRPALIRRATVAAREQDSSGYARRRTPASNQLCKDRSTPGYPADTQQYSKSACEAFLKPEMGPGGKCEGGKGFYGYNGNNECYCCTNIDTVDENPFTKGGYTTYQIPGFDTPLPVNCKAANSDGLCTTCEDSLYLSTSGDCLEECPAGSLPGDSPAEGSSLSGDQALSPHVCKPCQGVTRRRVHGAASECTKCSNGHVPKTDSDWCQNIQDTCPQWRCLQCKQCMEVAEKHVDECASGPGCIDFNKVWCPKLMSSLQECESFGIGCYHKLLCHSPRVCPEWKEVRCGGSTTDSLTQEDLTKARSEGERSSQANASLARLDSALDGSLGAKCHD